MPKAIDLYEEILEGNFKESETDLQVNRKGSFGHIIRTQTHVIWEGFELTDTLIEICELIVQGMHIETVAPLVGYRSAQITRWLERGALIDSRCSELEDEAELFGLEPDYSFLSDLDYMLMNFAMAFNFAVAECVRYDVRNLRKAAKVTPSAAIWRLTHGYHKDLFKDEPPSTNINVDAKNVNNNNITTTTNNVQAHIEVETIDVRAAITDPMVFEAIQALALSQEKKHRELDAKK